MYVCMYVHNTAQNSSDNLPGHPTDSPSPFRCCLLNGRVDR